RLHVDEVEIHPVDLGFELRERVQPRLALAPVVFARPVPGELLHRRQLYALRPILDQLPGGRARRGDAAAQLGEFFLGYLELEGADLGCRFGGCHVDLPIRSRSTPQIVEGRRICGDEARGSQRTATRRTILRGPSQGCHGRSMPFTRSVQNRLVWARTRPARLGTPTPLL